MLLTLIKQAPSCYKKIRSWYRLQWHTCSDLHICTRVIYSEHERRWPTSEWPYKKKPVSALLPAEKQLCKNEHTLPCEAAHHVPFAFCTHRQTETVCVIITVFKGSKNKQTSKQTNKKTNYYYYTAVAATAAAPPPPTKIIHYSERGLHAASGNRTRRKKWGRGGGGGGGGWERTSARSLRMRTFVKMVNCPWDQ